MMISSPIAMDDLFVVGTDARAIWSSVTVCEMSVELSVVPLIYPAAEMVTLRLPSAS